jgi:ectoine hydroxylase-related dioxygenase (phytanoyl-CoA dioxygenase family)
MAFYDKSFVPTTMNPDLSPEQEREVAFFVKWGYLIIEDAISGQQVESLKAALNRAYERKMSQGEAIPNDHLSDKMFIHQLLEEDEAFVFLLDNPPVIARMQAILGNCLQLHSATARVTEGGEKDQDWHRDGPWPMDPAGTPYGSMPGQINCGYFLDETTDENGPIVILPGSQRALFKPPEGHAEFPDEKRVYAKPGQAVLFDGWLYHRGAANRSASRRRVCLMCYQNARMKSREPFDGPTARRLQDEGTDLQKLLMGGQFSW